MGVSISQKKIILIGPFPPPITGESMANTTFAHFLSESNIAHEIIDTTNNKYVSSSHGKFSFAKVFNFFNAYTKLYKIFQYNIVYITIGQTFFGVVKYAPFIILSYLTRKPFFIHLHGNYLGTMYENLPGFKKLLVKKLISPAKAAIVLTESLKSNFSSIITSGDRVHVVGNFASNHLYKLDISRKKFDYLRIVYMSNLMREKGIIDLLEALKLLQLSNIRFHAHIAGAIEESLEKEVHEKMSYIGSDRLSFHGVVSGNKKEQILYTSNVFVLPTYYKIEGQPISIIEALATGNIIVTTKQGGISDFITEENGYFVEKQNHTDLTDKLIFIAENIGKLRDMSSKNKQYALSAFTEEIFGKKIIQVMDKHLT